MLPVAASLLLFGQCRFCRLDGGDFCGMVTNGVAPVATSLNFLLPRGGLKYGRRHGAGSTTRGEISGPLRSSSVERAAIFTPFLLNTICDINMGQTLVWRKDFNDFKGRHGGQRMRDSNSHILGVKRGRSTTRANRPSRMAPALGVRGGFAKMESWPGHQKRIGYRTRSPSGHATAGGGCGKLNIVVFPSQILP